MGGGAASGYLFEGSAFQWGPNDEIVYTRYTNNTATGQVTSKVDNPIDETVKGTTSDTITLTRKA